MTNEEKNKILQAYMGWELKWVNNFNDYSGWAFVNKDTGETITGMTNESTLPFSTDWNYLMPLTFKFYNTMANTEKVSEDLCNKILNGRKKQK